MNNFTEFWYGKIHCNECMAIFNSEECPVCKQKIKPRIVEYIDQSGNKIKVSSALMGAIDYTVFSLLRLIQREWERELTNEDIFNGIEDEKKPSQKLIIVILFWSLFESLMDTFFEHAMYLLTENIKKDLLKRYFSIGIRLDKLYPLLFETNFSKDFISVSNENLYLLLIEIKKIRNEFIHGNPEAITDEIVNKVINNLVPIQKAWIDLYNLKCTRKPTS